ncbi:uncharacterized protein LOC119662793 isoform X2 [Teleopsis dalmanni]|uniref:uncharacterized protein LOC119662793 isoform X2 n=1 Tax=Teleopsis dalmanni TaxID=139649 RepID=UPI0018CF3180|nr:uncharacterized protein LOC119662793 isoform X2 [Teleopsis dalmanni]
MKVCYFINLAQTGAAQVAPLKDLIRILPYPLQSVYWSDCNTDCELNCDNIREGTKCLQVNYFQCPSGYFCAYGHVRRDAPNSECIPEYQCFNKPIKPIISVAPAPAPEA